MLSDNILIKGFEALVPFGAEMPKEELEAALQNHKVVPWSYGLLVFGTVAGLVVSVASYVSKQTTLFPVALGVTFLLGLGAREIRRLSLNRQEVSQVQSYARLIALFTEKVNLFAQQKKQLDEENKELKQGLDSLKIENGKIAKLTNEVNIANKTTQDVAEKLTQAAEKNKELNTELQNQIQMAAKLENDLKILRSSQEETAGQFKVENDKLAKQCAAMKKARDTAKETLNQFQITNRDLATQLMNVKNEMNQVKENASLLSEQNKKLEATNKELTKTHEKLKEDLQKREDLEKRLEETTAKLDKKVQKLSDVKKLKLEYEQKLEAQAKQIGALIEENGRLKHGSVPLLPSLLPKSLSRDPSPLNSPRETHSKHVPDQT